MIQIDIYTHDGNKITTYADSFDAAEINKQINDTGLNTIVIGDAIVHRTNISKVVPIREPQQAAE